MRASGWLSKGWRFEPQRRIFFLQPQWNPYPTLPRLPLRHGTILQCLSLSMAWQYTVWYQWQPPGLEGASNDGNLSPPPPHPPLPSSTHTSTAERESPIMTAMTKLCKYGFNLSGKVGIPTPLPLKQTNKTFFKLIAIFPEQEKKNTALILVEI